MNHSRPRPMRSGTSPSFQIIPTHFHRHSGFPNRLHHMKTSQRRRFIVRSLQLRSHHFLLLKTRFQPHFKAFFFIIILFMIVFGHRRSSTACFRDKLNSFTYFYIKKQQIRRLVVLSAWPLNLPADVSRKGGMQSISLLTFSTSHKLNNAVIKLRLCHVISPSLGFVLSGSRINNNKKIKIKIQAFN